MKVFIFLSLFVMTLLNFCNAASNMVASAKFQSIINIMDANPVIYHQVNQGKVYYLFSYAIEEEFLSIASSVVVEPTNSLYISTTLQGEIYEGNGYQCVGLVKVANDTLRNISTRSWVRGEVFGGIGSTKIFPPKGTILATFGSDGKYNHIHTVVYWGQQNGVHYVVDQNLTGSGSNPKGIIIKHAISYSPVASSGNPNPASNINNLGTYHIVKYGLFFKNTKKILRM